MSQNSFIATLNSIGHGNTTQQLSEELHHLVQSIIAHRAKGSLTLKLDISLSKDLQNGVVIKPTISSSSPKPNVSSLMYFNGDGMLMLRDPNQPDLTGLEVVEGGDDAKEVTGVTEAKHVS